MNSPEKLSIKKAHLVNRTVQILGVDERQAIDLLTARRLSSFRINRLKVEDDLSLLAELAHEGWYGTQCGFYDDGYSIIEGREAIVNSLAAKSGKIYIQNQASWLPVISLAPRRGEKILDVCAAPGGKASHIAENTHNEAELWVNDNSRTRLYKLRDIFARQGTRYSQQTMYGIDRLAYKLDHGSFDKILLDAPCSGEGLINLNNDKDFEYWSTAQIKRLQQLQKKGVMAAWKLLKPGGKLVYSTCTMAPEENEAVIDYLLTHADDARLDELTIEIPNKVPGLQTWNGKIFKSDLSGCLRLKPTPLIEAFFVASVSKLPPGEVRYTESNE